MIARYLQQALPEVLALMAGRVAAVDAQSRRRAIEAIGQAGRGRRRGALVRPGRRRCPSWTPWWTLWRPEGSWMKP